MSPGSVRVTRSTSTGIAGLHVELTAFVPVDEPVKLMRLRVRNSTARHAPELSLLLRGLVPLRYAVALGPHIVTSIDTVCGALFARNPFRAEFGGRIAFHRHDRRIRTMTGDRSSFIGRNGTLADPLAMEFTHLPGRVGAPLDPCGAVQARLTVPAREPSKSRSCSVRAGRIGRAGAGRKISTSRAPSTPSFAAS